MRNPLPDSSLVIQARDHGDLGAFGELVRRHQSSVRGFLRHLEPTDPTGADDLAQETFLMAHRTLERFDTSGRLDTWLLGIAFNLHRNAHRRAVRRLGQELPEELPSDEASPAERFAKSHDVEEALAALDTPERLAIHACYAQALSHSEAASVLQMPLGTLKTHLLRAKEKLRTHLSSWKTTP